MLIIAVLLAFLIYIEPETMIQRLRNITILTIIGFFVIYATDFVIRSIRWKLLLNACGATTQVWYLWSLLHSVWLLNNLLPGRLGELMRLKIVEEEFRADTGITIGTIIVEHFLDLIVLIGFAGISSYVIVGSFVVNQTISTVLTGVVVFVCVLLFILILVLIVGHRIVYNVPFLSKNLRDRLLQIYLSLKNSLRMVITNKTSFIVTIILSILLWMFETFTIFLIAQGIGLQVSYVICLLGASVGYLTFAVPITPGNIGTFELSTASLLSISPTVELNDAMIVPLVDRALKMLYLVCLGVPLFLYQGFTISKPSPKQN